MRTPTEIRRLLEIGLEEDEPANNVAVIGSEQIESNTALIRDPVTVKDVLDDFTRRYAPHLKEN